MMLSARSFPQSPRSPEYGEGFTVRKLDDLGRLRRPSAKHTMTRLLSLEPVGLREVDDDRWEVFYGPVLLGTLDETGKEPRFIRAG